MSDVYVHTWTRLSSATAYAAFRSACCGGGQPPQWTEEGDDPAKWYQLPDAAGGLYLRDYGVGLPTMASDFADATSYSAEDVVATYASSGGQGVILLAHRSTWWLMVCRPEPEARRGARESCLEQYGGVVEVGPAELIAYI
jgi:hypothetical protein